MSNPSALDDAIALNMFRDSYRKDPVAFRRSRAGIQTLIDGSHDLSEAYLATLRGMVRLMLLVESEVTE